MDNPAPKFKDISNYITSNLTTLYGEREAQSVSTIVLRHLLKAENATMFELRHLPLPSNLKEECDIYVEELLTGKPVQYVLGYTWFFDLRFIVNQFTLIPRGETEELVDIVLKENMGFDGSILDIGTGSGCIAITLAKRLEKATVTAWDISPGALETAEINAGNNSVSVNFQLVDLLSVSDESENSFDIIVSNPPYVRESEKAWISTNVLDYEPHSALFVPDEDPLIFYKAVLKKARTLLRKGGVIYFEINEALGEELSIEASKRGFPKTKIVRDIHNRDRIAIIRNNE